MHEKEKMSGNEKCIRTRKPVYEFDMFCLFTYFIYTNTYYIFLCQQPHFL